MFFRILRRLLIRLSIFGFVLYSYLTDYSLLNEMIHLRITGPVTPAFLIWAYIMVDMLMQFIPAAGRYPGCGKVFKKNYIEPEKPFDQNKFEEISSRTSRRAAVTMALWIIVNGLIGYLSLSGVIRNYELILLTFLYYIFDFICILFFCPFQYFINKNRCCIDCRIYNWSYFFFCTPLLFFRSFFSWSLFFVSLTLLFYWEYNARVHPERFFEISNTALRCQNCKDKICLVKKPYREKKKSR